jgi:hypothetical protein
LCEAARKTCAFEEKINYFREKSGDFRKFSQKIKCLDDFRKNENAWTISAKFRIFVKMEKDICVSTQQEVNNLHM